MDFTVLKENSKTKVFVVTDTEAGWDCVRGVYLNRADAVEYCAIRDGVEPENWEKQAHSAFIIHEETLFS